MKGTLGAIVLGAIIICSLFVFLYILSEFDDANDYCVNKGFEYSIIDTSNPATSIECCRDFYGHNDIFVRRECKVMRYIR